MTAAPVSDTMSTSFPPQSHTAGGPASQPTPSPGGPVSGPVSAGAPPTGWQRWSGILALVLAVGTVLGGAWAAAAVLGDQRWVRLQAAAAVRAEQVTRDAAQDDALARAEAERRAREAALERAEADERAAVRQQLGELQGTTTQVLDEVRAMRRAATRRAR